MRSRVEVFEEIRRDRRVGGLSIRQLAERHQVHRRTVRQALASATPPTRKGYARRFRQKAGFKGDSIAHQLRNLTGIRPYKP